MQQQETEIFWRQAWSTPGRPSSARPRARARPIQVSSTVFGAAVLALIALIIRLPNLGDPTYHIDEAFYLFVGERMHEGLWPYADIWDRKPAGLFLAYGILASFGGVLAYQIAALLFAWGTAFALMLIANLYASRVAACCSGVVYLALIGALAGGGGQSPVFYNLFIVVAMLLALRRALGELPHSLAADASAMLLCGLALTFKPTAVAEGIFVGLALLAVRWREQQNPLALASYFAFLTGVAAAPTLAIWLAVVANGHFETYWFATIESIFQVLPPHPSASSIRLTYLAHLLAPALVIALAGAALLWSDAAENRYRIAAFFTTGWLATAIGGFLIVPNFYDHYALPLAAALAAAGAAVFTRPRTGVAIAGLLVAQLCLVSGYPGGQLVRKAEAQAGYARAHAMLMRHAGSGCVFVYDATPALYRSLRPCGASRFLFPEHLSNAREANAIGADPSRELMHILAQDPAVIAIAKSPSVPTPNLVTRTALEKHLRRHYRKVGEATLVDVVGTQQVAIWRRSSASKPHDSQAYF